MFRISPILKKQKIHKKSMWCMYLWWKEGIELQRSCKLTKIALWYCCCSLSNKIWFSNWWRSLFVCFVFFKQLFDQFSLFLECNIFFISKACTQYKFFFIFTFNIKGILDKYSEIFRANDLKICDIQFFIKIYLWIR